MSVALNLAIRRLLAFSIDWCLLALWGGLLYTGVLLSTGGNPEPPAGPWRGQALAALLMTLPFTLYFAFSESSPWRASLGKRLLRLRVQKTSGAPASFGRTLLRNALKFLPWEMGHLLGFQLLFLAAGAGTGAAPFPPWLWAPAAIAMLGPLWWLVALVIRGRTPYDRWSGTQVVRAAQG